MLRQRINSLEEARPECAKPMAQSQYLERQGILVLNKVSNRLLIRLGILRLTAIQLYD